MHHYEDQLVSDLALFNIEGTIENTGGGILVVFIQVDERWSIGIDQETVVLYDGPRDCSGDNERVLKDIPGYWGVYDIALFVRDTMSQI